MAILRTSRAINEEALDNFFKYAVCRLGFNLYVRLGVYPNRVPWGSIQELELRVRFTSCHDCFSTSRFNNWLQRISAFMTDVKACKIRFDCQPEYYLLAGHFAAIETLVAFQKVTLTIAVDAEPDDILSMRRFETRPQLDVDRDMYLDMHCEPYERRDEWWWGYGLAENVLKRTLGSAVRVEDDKGVHLEFYPKQHWCSST